MGYELSASLANARLLALLTVSMGLGPLQAIYQAHIMKYLENRRLTEANDRKVWCFVGDGEMDEPESLGAISPAGRERF